MDLLRYWALVAIVLALLGVATAIGQWLRRQESSRVDRRAVEAYNARIQAWWFFGVVLGLAIIWQDITVILFGMLSFWALREFVTLTPTRIGDHRALFWVFFFFTPMQFVLVWVDNYGLYSVLIPVYAFLFIAVRSAISGDYDRFLERIAKVQCGLMICVYCLSFAPAMLYLKIEDLSGVNDPYAQYRTLYFFVTIVLFADLLEWAFSRMYGKHIIAEKIDPQLSWEGVLASAGCTAVAGAALAWATPFPRWWQAAAMSLLIALMAAAGSLTMAAIKRDRGELVTGNFVEGHGGVLSRIDSICFAAPVFYHVTRYFFAAAA
jgi:phosphatidate cytidylyltransferase